MNNLAGQNIVVFDLETRNECGTPQVGWKDYLKMGISVGCLFDFRSMDSLVFMEDNLVDLGRRLDTADMVVGFNILGFDVPLLEATLGPKWAGILPHVKTYDLLYWSRVSTGWSPTGGRFPRGLKLDDHLLGTFGQAHLKTADGAQAPSMWQEGRIGELVSYCLADVKREAMLFKHVWNGLPVKTQEHGDKKLKPPQDVLNPPMEQQSLLKALI